MEHALDAARFEAWRRLVARLGLVLDPRSGDRWTASDPAGAGLSIQVLGGDPATLPALRVTLPVPHRGFVVMPKRHALSLDGRRQTGDAYLDAEVALWDDDASIHALLDVETRGLLSHLVGRVGLAARGGALLLEPDACARLDSSEVAPILTGLIALAERMRTLDGEALVSAVARILTEDPLPGVRSRCARLGAELPALRGRMPGDRDADATDTSEAGLERLSQIAANPVNGIIARVAALEQLFAHAPLAVGGAALARARDLAEPILPALCRAATREKADAEVAVRLLVPYLEHGLEHARHALAALMRLPFKGAELLERIGPARRGHVVRHAPEAAMRGTGQRGDLLAALLPDVERDPYLFPSYLRALAEIGDARWAQTVARALSSPYENVPEEACAALAELGDLSAVALLKPYSEGLFRSGRLKTAARKAIRSLQGRFGASANPGALSLTDGEAGAVSLVERDGE